MASDRIQNEERGTQAQGSASMTTEDVLYRADESLYHMGLLGHQMASLSQKGRADLAFIKAWCIDIEQKQRACAGAYKALTHKQQNTAAELSGVKAGWETMRSQLEVMKAERNNFEAELATIAEKHRQEVCLPALNPAEIPLPVGSVEEINQLGEELGHIKEESHEIPTENQNTWFEHEGRHQSMPCGSQSEMFRKEPEPGSGYLDHCETAIDQDSDTTPIVITLKRSREQDGLSQGEIPKKTRKRKQQKKN